MDHALAGWASLALRWFHLIAGIAWIGSSFYFMWLDASLEAPKVAKKGVEGELWMVHSGGFYQVEKRLIGPGEMPATLHWFKYEALFTLLSGLALLIMVYYTSGGAYLIDPAKAQLTPSSAISLSVILIATAWVVYDGLWQSPLGQGEGKIATGVSFLLLFGAAYGLTQVFSGRAAYIHVGAMMGTLMVLNVWVRILPAQQKMIDATKEGKTPDFSNGHRAKKRSVHNSYMTFPVLFMMISNHYPSTYGHPLSWLVLILLIFIGAGIRHAMILQMKKVPRYGLVLAPVALALIGVIVLTAPRTPQAIAHDHAHTPVEDRVNFIAVHDVINRRCLQCHSTQPTDDVFKEPPSGIVFDRPEQVKMHAPRIKSRAVDTHTMPLANKTGMTEDERALLGKWVDQGAKVD